LLNNLFEVDMPTQTPALYPSQKQLAGFARTDLLRARARQTMLRAQSSLLNRSQIRIAGQHIVSSQSVPVRLRSPQHLNRQQLLA
jgi:hypothetical protein